MIHYYCLRVQSDSLWFTIIVCECSQIHYYCLRLHSDSFII